MTKKQIIENLKKILNQYFENDPWTGEKNKNYDECYSAQDVVDDVIDLINQN